MARESSNGTHSLDDQLAALDEIRFSPAIGIVYRATSGREHRRVLMPSTRYHIYYRLVAPDRIRAIWSAVRGRGPGLR